MDVDAAKVHKIIAQNKRFCSPFSEPYGYYIWTDQWDGGENFDEEMVDLYLDKLAYAAQNVDILIRQASLAFQFHSDMSEILWQRLVFDSFVLFPRDKEIGCCLSNADFMYGHFIECRWDYDWNLLSVGYC